jgi:peptidoglycan/LPS O-acetylase OafA/YrhL
MYKQIESAKARGQIAALDGVRGVAILLVFCIHLQQTGVVPSKFRVINVLMHSGWSGVDLFFVLSGFLITLGLLESRESVNYFSAFYMRRVLRIFPLYYFALSAGMIASIFLANYSPNLTLVGDNPSGPLFPSWPGWISHIFYLQNWWMPWKEPASRSIFGHFWSLAIEEQFYLVWPLCVWLLPRKRLLVLCVAVCAGAPALRFFLIGHYHVAPEIIFRNTVTRADTLMAGALCALVARDCSLLAHVRRWLPAMAVLGAAYLVAVVIAVPEPTAQVFYADTLGFTALALIFGPLVMWAYSFTGD